MGYILDLVSNLNNIDLNNVYVNGTKSVAVPRKSVDGALFILNGDNFDGLQDSNPYPKYFTEDGVKNYILLNSNNWNPDILP